MHASGRNRLDRSKCQLNGAEDILTTENLLQNEGISGDSIESERKASIKKDASVVSDKPTAGPDGCESWLMSGACFLTTLIVGGSTRSAAVLYIAIMSTFNVSRGEAAWPVSLTPGIANLAGLISGPLNQKFGTRKTMVAGGLLSVLSLIGCYFANSVLYLTICFGVINGLGIGLVYNLNPVILNTYFDKYKGFAMGINYCGSTIAAMMFPKVMEFLYGAYGLKGTLLILGAISMNNPALCCLMKPPSWFNKKAGKDTQHKKLTSARSSPELPLKAQQDLSRKNLSSICTSGEDLVAVEHQNFSTIHDNNKSESFSVSESMDELTRTRRNTSDSSLQNTRNILENFKYNCRRPSLEITIFDDKNYNTFNETKGEAVTNNNKNKSEDLNNKNKLDAITQQKQSCQKVETDSNVGGCNPSEIFSRPIFYLLIVSYIVFCTCSDIFITVMVDILMDKNISMSQSISTIPQFSVADMLGRVTLPLVADRGIIGRKQMFTLNFLMLGLMTIALTFLESYWHVTGVCLGIGWSYGCAVVMFPVLVSDYLGMNNLAVANGLITASAGILTFGRPALIGYFRDTIGSYTKMLLLFGILLATQSVLWAIVLFSEKLATKKWKVWSTSKSSPDS